MVQRAAESDSAIRTPLAPGAGQPLRPAGTREDPDPGLGLAEARRLRRDDQVAGERELAAASEAPAADGCDERSREAADPIPALDPTGERDVDGGHLREPRDVG